jgi:succinate dehydrogenase/fumarate reductase flavoprotein subunit
LETDVLVICSGAASLRAAIEAKRSKANVTVVDKSLNGVNNNTAFAGGGFKAALPGILNETRTKQYTTPEEHIVDTICVLACPTNCLWLDYEAMKVSVTDMNECIVCRNCEEQCPLQIIEVWLEG